MKLRQLLLIPLVAVSGFLLFPTVTFADDAAPPPVTLDAENVSTVAIAAPIVTILVAVLLPLLNGLLTKISTSSGVKALLTALLAGISAIITNGIIADGSAVFTTQTLYTFLVTWGISVLSYVGAYKPLGITSSAVVDKATGEVHPGSLATKGIH